VTPDLKIVVTGGCGFIGSNLTNFLNAKFYRIPVFDINEEEEYYLSLKMDKISQIDLTSINLCLIETEDIDWVFNLAVNIGGIGIISKVGLSVLSDNPLINTNIMEACRETSVQRVFFSSSTSIYPSYRQEAPNVESLKQEWAPPLMPDQFYVFEKLFTEKLMEEYKKDDGIEIRIARLHNIYCPYETYKSERKKAPAALCRKVVLAKDGDSIEIWDDGKQTRSFLYFDDALEAIYKLTQPNFSKPLNIASDELISINEFAGLIIEISGKHLTKCYDMSNPHGVQGRNTVWHLLQRYSFGDSEFPTEIDQTKHTSR
jgi:nucleoside-diphosphate-sugar epimerase